MLYLNTIYHLLYIPYTPYAIYPYTQIYDTLYTGNSTPKMSNELEVSLPLESDHINLPPKEIRINDVDLYKEYLEVREGSGFQPEMSRGSFS